MIDPLAAQLALRARALNLVVCTTGTTDLAATTTGYSRLTGSFVDDGFKVGMEITPAGYAANTIDTLTEVTALTVKTKTARAAESSASGRSISVGLPSKRVWENNVYAPVIAGLPYIEDEFVPGSNRRITAPAQGGKIQETGIYYLKWYLPSGVGVAALRACVAALAARYTSGTVIGPVIVDGAPGPTTSQILPVDGGLSVLSLRVPWFARSTNIIAA